jgi:PEGA domain-containing protein
MKLKIVMLLGLLFGFAAMAFPQSAELSITSFPPGASVSIDGVTLKDKDNSSPVTPMNVNLSLGPHNIHVGLNDPGWQPYNSTVNIIKADNDLSVVLIPVVQTGPQGPMGLQGLAATIQLGSVTTGLPGSQASVTNSGTVNGAVLNFVIPQGIPGAPSIIPGPQGIPGPMGAPCLPTNPACVGPQGPAGQSIVGPQGPAGAASTLPGPVGPQGPAGPAGPSGFAGVWNPSRVPYPTGAIVLRPICTPAMWAVPPSCAQGVQGPWFCLQQPACINSDAVQGDPIVDTSEWILLLSDAANGYVPAQQFNAPITTTLQNPAIVVDNGHDGLTLAACYYFAPASGGTIAGPTNSPTSGCRGALGGASAITGPGLGTSPAAGSYSNLTVSLPSNWGGSSSAGPIDGPLTVEILGPSFNVDFICQVPIGSTQCSAHATPLSLIIGSTLGIEIYSTSGFVQFGGTGNGSAPNVTVTLMP